MSAHGIRSLLRDRYPCSKCGAEKEKPCQSEAGNDTQPHRARWQCYWDETGYGPDSSVRGGSAPRGIPDRELAGVFMKLERARGLIATAGELVSEAVSVISKRVDGRD